MKVFLSAIENNSLQIDEGNLLYTMIRDGKIKPLWNLMSYFYIREKRCMDVAEFVRDHSEEILIDSGAHSFQKGKKVDWEAYTREYAEFIKKFDRPNVIGYFEMDVDNILGYEKVLKLRHILDEATPKVIPVWHKNRGIAEFKRMCEERAGKVVAITGWANMEIKDDQYMLFLKEAKKHGCKLHCLGMTRKKILDKVPFDYVDSASWRLDINFGNVCGRKATKQTTSMKGNFQHALAANYQYYLDSFQRYYHEKWKLVCNDTTRL